MPPQNPGGPGPKWAKKRIVIPAAGLLFFVGVGIGASDSSSAEATSDAKPAPTVTVTATAPPAATKAKPTPTVTVTKTVTVTPKPKPKPTKKAASKDQAVFKVWGTAPNGASITYGSDSENLDGSGLPMTKTLKVKDDALYYMINAQLQGGGDIKCSVTIDGKTKSGRARGDYNICTAQLNSDFFGSFS